MAHIMTDEGLDHIMGIFPKNGTNDATLYIGLFTSQTASTVPASTATGGVTPSGWTEATGTAYARVALAAATWGAQAAGTGGRKSTYPQISFATVGAGGWGTANGYFIATASASGSGDKILGFANFDDTTAIVTAANDVVKVTPVLQLNN